jgi:hypothetical protein
VDSFEAFLADMGRKPSPQHVFTRINRDDNYKPGNLERKPFVFNVFAWLAEAARGCYLSAIAGPGPGHPRL